jgi:hypothetical protein
MNSNGNQRTKVPAMATCFDHMITYHLSYRNFKISIHQASAGNTTAPKSETKP